MKIMEIPKALILTIIVLNVVSKTLFLLYCHITYPAISDRSLQYRQSAVPFIDSSVCPEVFLKNIADLTGIHLYRSLFFHKVACLSPEALLKIRHSNKGVTILTYVHGALRSFFVDYIKGKFWKHYRHYFSVSCYYILNGILDFIFAILGYVQSALRKKSAILDSLIAIKQSLLDSLKASFVE